MLRRVITWIAWEPHSNASMVTGKVGFRARAAHLPGVDFGAVRRMRGRMEDQREGWRIRGREEVESVLIRRVGVDEMIVGRGERESRDAMIGDD